MANVRFYRLETLPSFEVPKHQGIFVHVTSKLTRTGKEGNYAYSWGSLSTGEIQNIVIQKIVDKKTTRPVLVPDWMNLRRLDTVESGLWFGGENGWELLSNETTSGAIDAAIDDKINALNAGGFTQATIGANTTEGSESATGSTLTILGIKEFKGKIEQDDTKNVDIAIDGVYNENTNKIATQSTVTTAIEALDVQTPIQAVTFNTSADNGNTTLTFNGVKEVDGRIAQGDEQTPNTFIVGDAKLNIQIGSATINNVFSANAQSDGAIKLNEKVFTKDENNIISVITLTAVSENNKLVTQQDIASLGGAMHYKTTIANASAWPTTVKAGDVYIASGENFEYNGQVIESGDMIVFNSENITDFTVVQSNITSGIKGGQIAKNDGDLTPNYMVIATSGGIKTIEFDGTNLTSTENGNNTRNLTYTNGTEDTTGEITLHHDVTISDALKVIGKDFTKSIKISSTNRSIEIAKNSNDTGVVVDLVWNTSMDPDSNN